MWHFSMRGTLNSTFTRLNTPILQVNTMSFPTAASVTQRMTDFDVMIQNAVQAGDVDTVMEKYGAEIVSEAMKTP